MIYSKAICQKTHCVKKIKKKKKDKKNAKTKPNHYAYVWYVKNNMGLDKKWDNTFYPMFNRQWDRICYLTFYSIPHLVENGIRYRIIYPPVVSYPLYIRFNNPIKRDGICTSHGKQILSFIYMFYFAFFFFLFILVTLWDKKF